MKPTLWKLVEYLAGEKQSSGFALQRAMLKWMGCFWWQKQTLFKRLYSVCFVLVQIISVLTVTAFIMKTKIKTTEDFTQVINSLIVSVSFSTGILKLLIVHWQSRHFVAMIEFLEDFPPDGIVWQAKEKFLAQCFCTFATIGGWLMYGIITKGWPWDANFPWDKNTLLGHCLGLCLQAFSAVPGGSTHLVVDSIISAAVDKLMPQIRKLKESLAKIGPHSEENSIHIKDAVNLHTSILRSVYLINSSFSWIIIFQVIYLVPFICINAFVVTKIGDIHYIITSVLPMSMTMFIQLYMYCGAGQLLATEMEKMDIACYDNQWYLAPVPNQKELSVIMECSRMQISINAYGFVFADFPTLLAVVQQSYSYFLFLHSMADAIESY